MYPYKSLGISYGLFRSITAAFGPFPEAVVNKLLHVMEVRRQRRALANLDDRLLKDIGLSRCDVEQEISRSLWR